MDIGAKSEVKYCLNKNGTGRQGIPFINTCEYIYNLLLLVLLILLLPVNDS